MVSQMPGTLCPLHNLRPCLQRVQPQRRHHSHPGHYDIRFRSSVISEAEHNTETGVEEANYLEPDNILRR